MDNELLCNFKKCRKPLSSQAWDTCTLPIYRPDTCFVANQTAAIIPRASRVVWVFTPDKYENVGSTALSGKYDIVKVDLNPNEQYKSMVLAGQRPEVIFEVCSRAIAFWSYQVHQEIMFQKYVTTKAKQNSMNIEKYYQDALQRTKNDLISIKENQECTQKDLEAFKKKTAELSEKLTERIRQYQKLQSLYEALKRKIISPSFFERQANEEKLLEKSKLPFVMSTASEIICPQGNKSSRRSKRMNYTEVEKEFVLRPAHTPTDDISVEPQLHFASQEQFRTHDKRNIPPKKTRMQN